MGIRVHVEELIDDTGEHFGAYCMGHVDKEQFCAAYKDEFDNEIKPDDVDHILARKVPNMIKGYYEGWKLIEVCNPGRGVFEATLYKA